MRPPRIHATATSRLGMVAALALAAVSPSITLRGQSSDPAPARRPNIVVLFADDAGYADFGFQPGAARDLAGRTPHIDSIARDGARFSAAYMSGCVCSPSRAGLMTGRYQSRFGHENNVPPGYMQGGMALAEKTVADRLHDLGYTTGLVGKWHLGYPGPYQPNQRGFDWFYGCLQGSRAYFPMKKTTPHRVIQENGKPTPEGGYVTDRFGDAAARFIGEHKEGPFFLFVSFTAPHGPLQAKAEDLETLSDIEKPRRRKYAGLIRALDDNVGKVLRALDRHGIADNTMVVFTNDNGGQTQTGANNAPLSGRKGQLLEGGIRVPMCMRWPNKIAAGTAIEDPVISLDLLPTFVGAAGGTVDPEWRLDGIDLGPRLTAAQQPLEARPLFWRKGGKTGELAIRLGQHKLLFRSRGPDQQPALYDLAADPGETKDLAAQQPDLVQSLRGRLTAWEAELIDPLWGTRKRGRNAKRRQRRAPPQPGTGKDPGKGKDR